MRILAIDPGNVESAYCLVDENYIPLEFGKIENEQFLQMLEFNDYDELVIEMIGHYGTGMAVGETVFDTCIMIGRIIQAVKREYTLIKRKTVVAHLCGSVKATDSNITQALIDRFAKGVRNYGKGTKNDKGYFYGFYKDIWAAYALAVTYIDMKKEQKQ